MSPRPFPFSTAGQTAHPSLRATCYDSGVADQTPQKDASASQLAEKPHGLVRRYPVGLHHLYGGVITELEARDD